MLVADEKATSVSASVSRSGGACNEHQWGVG